MPRLMTSDMGVPYQTTVCRHTGAIAQRVVNATHTTRKQHVGRVGRRIFFKCWFFSDDSSDEWSCSWHSFDDPILGDDENMTVQPYQFEPELDEEEEDQEISVGNDQDRTRNTLTQA